MLTYILLLQKAPTYPESHPLSQCPLDELQVTLSKQCPLQLLLHSLPNVPTLHPVVNNKDRLFKPYEKTLLKYSLSYDLLCMQHHFDFSL